MQERIVAFIRFYGVLLAMTTFMSYIFPQTGIRIPSDIALLGFVLIFYEGFFYWSRFLETLPFPLLWRDEVYEDERDTTQTGKND